MSYSKPILSAEGEETLMVLRHIKTIAVPKRSYIMEFETGYPTASNSVIKCQEEAVLMNGSILKNVVQHREFQVMIEEEIFQKQGDKVLAMSSSEILNCNPHDPAAGCEGALHTYTGNPTEPACPFRAVREVNGIPQYFIAEEGQFFYELNRSQNLPLQCGSKRIKLNYSLQLN